LLPVFPFFINPVFAIDPPQDLAVVSESDRSATLYWSGVATAEGYNLYRDDTYFATASGTATFFSDPIAGSSYYLTSFASDPREYSLKSNRAMLDSNSG
jgi:hypothetical protein